MEQTLYTGPVILSVFDGGGSDCELVESVLSWQISSHSRALTIEEMLYERLGGTQDMHVVIRPAPVSETAQDILKKLVEHRGHKFFILQEDPYNNMPEPGDEDPDEYFDMIQP